MDCCDLLLAGAIFNVHAMPNCVLLCGYCRRGHSVWCVLVTVYTCSMVYSIYILHKDACGRKGVSSDNDK